MVQGTGRDFTIAAAQLGPIHRSDSRASAVKRLMDMLRAAHAKGAGFVVFPELALTTFFPRWTMHDQAEIDAYFEREMPGPETRPLFDLARELGVGFYLGYAEITQEDVRTRRFNTSIIVDPAGRIVGKYRKVHLPGHAEPLPDAPFQHLEKRYFEVGNLGFPVWRTMGHVMGMAICNDRRWPEVFRVMALQGAELVVLGYNTPNDTIFDEEQDESKDLKVFQHLLCMQAASYQNGIWTVATAKAGVEDGFGLFGASCIVSPTGEIAAQTQTEDDEVIVHPIDWSVGDYMRRTTFHFASHRRVETYGRITSQTGVEIADHPKKAAE